MEHSRLRTRWRAKPVRHLHCGLRLIRAAGFVQTAHGLAPTQELLDVFAHDLASPDRRVT
ncbi:MAG: hypothetical protein ACYDB1_12190 [Acidiferrobacteraceae bacterium]